MRRNAAATTTTGGSAARAVDVQEEKIEATHYWQVSDLLSQLERAVLAFAAGIALDGGRRVHDKVFDAAR